MRAIQIAALVLATLTAWACGDGHGIQHSDDHDAPGHVAAGEGLALVLNHGERWEMDGHSRSLFATMTGKVEGEVGDIEARKALGSALREDIDELIRGCTMTGDAHAELHKFLVALIPAVEGLAASGGDEELGTVRELLETYPSYFE